VHGALARGIIADNDRLRARTNFSRRFNPIAVARVSTPQIPLAASGKSPAHFRASRLDEEGRYAIVTSVGVGCDGRDEVAAG
jgi:hypothetical protein